MITMGLWRSKFCPIAPAAITPDAKNLTLGEKFNLLNNVTIGREY
jgi:hypothetical protein